MSALSAFQAKIQNKTLEDMNKHFKDARANKGFGSLGPWPDEDPSKKTDYDVYTICSVRLEVDPDGKFKWGKDDARKEVDAMRLQFEYEAEMPEGTFPFKGMWADIPYDIDALPNSKDKGGKQQGRVNFQLGRFKGALEALLNAEYDGLIPAVEAFLKLQDEADEKKAELMANVKLEFRQNTYVNRDNEKKTRTEKLDFIQDIVQTVAAPASD